MSAVSIQAQLCAARQILQATRGQYAKRKFASHRPCGQDARLDPPSAVCLQQMPISSGTLWMALWRRYGYVGSTARCADPERRFTLRACSMTNCASRPTMLRSRIRFRIYWPGSSDNSIELLRLLRLRRQSPVISGRTWVQREPHPSRRPERPRGDSRRPPDRHFLSVSMRHNASGRPVLGLRSTQPADASRLTNFWPSCEPAAIV